MTVIPLTLLSEDAACVLGGEDNRKAASTCHSHIARFKYRLGEISSHGTSDPPALTSPLFTVTSFHYPLSTSQRNVSKHGTAQLFPDNHDPCWPN